jgi:phage-related protein
VPIYSAGSASVKIVPDFSGAQKDIGEWFARQGDLRVKIKPEVDDRALLESKAKINSVVESDKPKLEVDEEHLARSIGRGIDEALRSLSTVDTLNAAVQGAIMPSMISVLVGGLVELGSSLTQVIGVLNLVPALLLGLAAPMATVLVGISGMTTAFKIFSAQTPAQLKVAQQALNKLAPAARDFVMQVHQLAPAFHALRMDVQQQLFQNLGTAVDRLGRVAFPVMQKGLAGIASGLNSGLIATMQRLTTMGPAFTTIFGNIDKSVATVANGAMPMLTADFVALAKVGSQFLPQLASGFVTLSQKFDAWLTHAMNTGAIVRQIQQAFQVITQVSHLVMNLGGSISSIFSAALPFGNQLLALLNKVTGALSAFLKTSTAQDGLKTFFADVDKVAQTLLPVLLQMVQVLVADVLPVIGDLAAAIAPVIGELGKQLAETVAHITQMLPPLAEVIASLIEGMQPLIPVLGQIVETLLPPFLVVGKQLGPVIDGLARTAAGILLQAAQALAPALSDLGTAFLHILGAITPMIAPLGTIVTSLLPPMLLIIQALLPFITTLVDNFAHLGTTVLIGLQPAIKALAETLSNVVLPVIKFLGPALPPLVESVIAWQLATGALGLVMEAIKFGQWIAFVVQYAIQVDLAAAATKGWAIAQAAWAVVTNLGTYASMAAALAKYVVTVDLVSAATKAWAIAQAVLDALMSPVVLVILAITVAVAALAFGIYELVTHWTTVWATIKQVAVDVWHALEAAADFAWNKVIKPVFAALETGALWLYNNVLHPVFTGIVAAWNALGVAFQWTWDNVLHPLWVVIEDVAKVLLAILGVVVFGPIALLWKGMSELIALTYRDVIKPCWDAMQKAAVWLYQNALLPTWHAIETAWRALGTALRWVYDNVVKPCWDAMQKAAVWLYQNALLPTWHAIETAWRALGTALRWVYDNVIQPSWHALQTAASFMWNSVLKPIWHAIQTGWSALGDGLRWVYDHTVAPIWGFFHTALSGLQGAFRTAVSVIGDIWHGIEALVAKPVNFVINTILDGGLFKAWNWIVDTLHLPGGWKLHVDPIPGFAEGGFTGPGMFGTGGKHDPAGVVHANEFVVNQEQTRKHLPLLQAINSGMAGYADGGLVGWLGKTWNSVTDVFGSLSSSITGPIGQLFGQFGNGDWEQMLAKIPQTLLSDMWSVVKNQVGGALSTAISAVTNFVTGGGNAGGGTPASRASNVAAVRSAAAGYGWSQGQEWNDLVAVIMRESGFNNVAQNPTSTAFGMFQFLDSTWASYGAKTANPALQAKYGMEYIAGRYHDPIGAWNHEQLYGWYDQGGYLPPGFSTVYNGTGRPEPVLTAAQNDALMRLAGFGPTGSRSGGGNVPLIGSLSISQTGDPRAVMDELWYDLRVASRGGVYSLTGATP